MTAIGEPLTRVEMGNMLFPGTQKREEYVGYYRKPDRYTDQHGIENDYQEAGWITTADTQDDKQYPIYVRRGWTPLPQFGRVVDSFDRWRPILTHREGPAAFPVLQILTYRWYDKAKLPGTLRGQDIYFPQLAGVEITEHPCPECTRVSYFDPIQVARHLVNKHGYDRSDVIALGDRYGIDFTKSMTRIIKPPVAFVYPAQDSGPAAADPAGPRVIRKVVPSVKAGAPLLDDEATDGD